MLNNLGWDRYEAGAHEEALDAFERALAARQRDLENPEAIAIARYAVAKALQALDRHADATTQLELAVAWTEAAGEPDGWFHEALAESYAVLGRTTDAREHASRAAPLLADADPTFAADEARVMRLRELADAR